MNGGAVCSAVQGVKGDSMMVHAVIEESEKESIEQHHRNRSVRTKGRAHTKGHKTEQVADDAVHLGSLGTVWRAQLLGRCSGHRE